MRRRLAGLAALSVAAGLALAACSPSENGGDEDEFASPSFAECDDNPLECNSGPRAEGGEINWLINQGWDGTWNRETADGNTSYLNQALRGIFPDLSDWQPDATWGWDLNLYESEPELINDDPMTIVYKIREEAVWSDGHPITVDDFVFRWHARSGREDHCDGCTPPATTGWDSLASIEGSDGGKTVTITYEDGVADAEWFGRFGPTYPAHVVEQAGIDWRTPEGMAEAMDFFTTNVPTWAGGPYIIESAIVDELVIMVPNEAWWGEPKPTLDRIVKRVISDQGSWISALGTEEIHGGWPASWTPDFRQQLAGLDNILSITGSAGGVWEHVDFNMDSVTDVALRKAIFTVINTEHARSSIWGDIAPPLRTNHHFAQISPHHQDHLSATGFGTGDADAARAILEDAGYTGAEEGGTLTDPDGEPVPSLRFAYLAGNENRATFVELAIAYLGQIGITVEPDPTPGDQLGTVLGTQDFDLVIFGWSGSPFFTGAPHQFYHSSSGSNYGRLNNPEIDELAEQVRNQTDVAESAALVNQLVPMIMDEAFSLPLWDNPALVFVSDKFINVRPNYNSQLNPQYNNHDWGVAAVE